MTQENNNDNVEQTAGRSVFGLVLGRFMEARGIPADPEHFRDLGSKGGLDPDEFLARVTGESMEHPGGMEGVVDELGMEGEELHELSYAFAFERERPHKEVASSAREGAIEVDPERVPRPEEAAHYEKDQLENQKLRPLRCQAASKTDHPCTREATTWMHPEDRDYPACLEHARTFELFEDVNDWGIAEEVTGDWLRVARVWRNEPLENLAEIAHETAKEKFLKSEAEQDLFGEIANAAGKGEDRPELTPEQDEKLRRLFNRTAGLMDAYTALEDHATGEEPEESLRRTLAVLIEERERVEAETQRYKEEIGLA